MYKHKPTSLAIWKEYSFNTMANLGAIHDGSVITLKHKLGIFQVVKVSHLKKDEQPQKVISFIILENDDDTIPIINFPQFIARSLNKKKKDVTAEDFYHIIIDGISWPDFRKMFIKLHFMVYPLVSELFLI